MPRTPTSGSSVLAGLLLVVAAGIGLGWWLVSPGTSATASVRTATALPRDAPPCPAETVPLPVPAVLREWQAEGESGWRVLDPVPEERRRAHAGRSLEGFVQDEAGRPLTGVHAVLLPTGNPLQADAIRIRRTPVDEAGRFRFSGIGAGPWLAQVREPGQPAAYSQDLGRLGRGVQRCTLVVPRQVTLHLTVRTRLGDPAPERTVLLIPQPSGSSWSAATDAEGVATFRFVRLGRYRLSVLGVGGIQDEERELTQLGPWQESLRLPW